MFKRTAPLGTAFIIGCIAIGGAGCGSGTVPVEKRTFRDTEGRFTYVVPPNWVVWMGEARSPKGSLFSVEPVSLEDSAPDFIAGLPSSMVPLVKEQTGRFFSVVGNPVQKATTLGGVGALEVSFPVRIRAADPESKVTFWIARHGNTVFVLRVSHPAGTAAEDAPALGELIASWKFSPLPTLSPDTQPGRLVPQVPVQWTPVPR